MPAPKPYLPSGGPPNAARFIVTVYGDIVEPRGGVLWMGSLIDVCALVGLSESLVRTAVSRLVAAGRLEGSRQGRRSYYRLTRAGAVEFSRASELIFGGASPAHGWCLVHAPKSDEATRLERAGFARIGPAHLIGSDSLAAYAMPHLHFRVEALTPGLSDWARDLWPLDAQARDYREFTASVLASPASRDLTPEASLASRLMLVETWRSLVLADPRLPQVALPKNWPGREASRVFARRYLRISPAAEIAIEKLCSAQGGRPLEPGQALAKRQRWLNDVLA